MSDFYQAPRQDAVPKDQTELVQKQKKELKFIGRLKAVPGLTIFSYNIKTGEIKTAPLKCDVAIDARTRQPVRRQTVTIEKDCLYRQALNRKNFIRKLIREGVAVKES